MTDSTEEAKVPKKKVAKKAIGIFEKLHAIQLEVGRMGKDGRNTAQNYDFLSEAQITEAFKELLEKHRVFFTYSSSIDEVRLTPTGKQFLTDVTIDYEFIDIDSGEVHSGFASGQGSDSTDKGVYKAITGAVKYIFMKTFLIPTGDDPEKDVKKRRVPTAVPAGATMDKPPFGEGAEDEDED